MKTDLRTAGVNGTLHANSGRGRALKVLLSLVVLTTTGCSDLAPPAASANMGPQPDLPANVSQAATHPPAEGLTAVADEIALDHVGVSSGDKARVVFLHGLHSPFGTALAMSRIPTPR